MANPGISHPPITTDEIQTNFHRVLEQIGNAAVSAGRHPGEVRLVVVTKGHPLETVQAAVQAGAGLLGENYVEEAEEKVRSLGDVKVEWHMIGHVQSRKAEAVCRNFDWVHSVDSLKLAYRLDRFAGEMGRTLPVLLECNVSGEATKSGWAAWEEVDWGRLAESLKPLIDLHRLKVRGLMTMAPFCDDPGLARPYFRRLRRLRDCLASWYPQVDWSELSMGMSGDFTVGVEQGATLVRVGTAILGPRPGA